MTDIDHDFQLILQREKTTFLLINPSHKPIENIEMSIHLGDKTILPKNACQCLGLTLDSKWTFEKHVFSICYRAYRLRFLYPHCKTLSINLKQQLCNSLVFSVTEYADVTYRSCLTEVSK